LIVLNEPFFIVKVGGGAVFNDDLNFRGKLWMKVKGASCLERE
jgi:hypothetical protein